MMSVKWNLVTLAVSIGISQLATAAVVSDQADAKGFVEDSSLNVHLKNYYFNRDSKNGSADRKDWTQGVLTNYSSGFTQGTVGFGVEAFGNWAFKLDGGAGTTGTGNLPVQSNGEPVDEYSRAGGALKMRISKTELLWGNLQPIAPVFAAGGSRLFPQTGTGFNLLSSEIKGLELDAGHFTGGNGPVTTNSEHDLFASYANVTANSISYAGGKYAVSDALSLSVYGSKLEDVWRQYYANANYTLPISELQSLNLDFNIYRTNDDGSAKAGAISNTAYSLTAAYTFLTAHTVTFAYQKVHGDTPFDYVAFGKNGPGDISDSINLANSIQYSDFNGPGEKSLQARYDLNLASLGIPGLAFMVRYIHGDNIDGTRMAANSPYRAYGYGENGKHHETNLEAKYTVQSGPVKDLSLRMRQAWHRGNADQAEGNVNEFRLIADYPISIF
ncbi:OprD family porin [Pseudomonas sp. 10B1]|uniref:OprD family porin n=1 Tax=unclassified Pseudomonas TaxID=196821 RepID=UPI002B22E553|nr:MULTISPECIES: OprD family porin [unclassified Pseudomonas]MEA9993886.1 OprD family porin [Pseudomonas sp. AA4]MEB0085434.1 OprD family porin [Pseudomonas sp. RTI1]MEB0124496.1 OprD family porin [Pseudomonas sp. CCC1.2]MEB0152357.1 OprD family porin [Pseudomonas sp. CCC4.3]MEB0220719.1 OprD family porin [Pseudomonas sp. AB12(2023)]